MSSQCSRGLTLVASIAILMTINMARAADSDDKAPPRGPEAKKFSGTVQQFNYTPRGERDGVLLSSDGKLVQLNFPPQEASKLAEGVAVGDQISAEGVPERTEADHTVCRLQKLTTAKGAEIEIDEPPARGRGPSPEGPPDRGPGDRGPGERAPGERAPGERAPGERGPRSGERGQRTADRGPRGERAPEKTETVKGVVKYLNHGPRGEVDGAVLESGDFVHIGPREAEEAKLAVGQDISVEGQSLKMPDGHTMIEHPTKINDKEVSRRPRGRGPGAGPIDREGPPPNRPVPPPSDEPKTES
jgi:hypothetical protein